MPTARKPPKPPTAREALLDAALAALGRLPWSAVRMVDVAAAARVSRQTLYNEFGSKEGLARALVRREADLYLRGVEAALAEPGPPARRLVAVAEWTVAAAGARPVLRALLTGAWGERLPAPRPARAGARPPAVPEQRRADAGVPTPGELLVQARDRAAALLAAEPDSGGGAADGSGDTARSGSSGRSGSAGSSGTAGTADRARRADAAVRGCELALRLALSYVVTPPARTGAAAQWAEPDSWRPMTPAITSVIETILRVDTTSPRKIIP
ncbi:TetR/AcrR family transcriptional regulator [Streptomyces sp. NPDC053493]|uniref:TetR/AcrR family transcriptional regulator n=1 Tax=Streptomyces sp. NPDC053493 TaxID=3365705 RepID=UPI0037CE40AA